jgi:glycopeptide antibiotics resistance protein
VNPKLAHAAAWLLLVAVAFVTLAPIGWRPNTGFSANMERFGAFAMIGLAFSLAYPRRLWLITLVVFGSALTFEALQFLAQTRHPGIRDLIAKVAGGSAGIVLGWLISTFWRRSSAADTGG